MEVRRRAIYTEEKYEEETFVEKIKKIDTFEKLPQECVNYTSSGGGGTPANTFASFLSFYNYFCDYIYACCCWNQPICKPWS